MNPFLATVLLITLMAGATCLFFYLLKKYTDREFEIQSTKWNQIASTLKCSRCGTTFSGYGGRVWADKGSNLSGPIIDCKHCKTEFHFWEGKQGPEIVNAVGPENINYP